LTCFRFDISPHQSNSIVKVRCTQKRLGDKHQAATW